MSNPNLTLGDRVFIYRNLHKKCWSVKSMETKLVIAHVNSIALEDVTFKVSEAGRQRVLLEKRKNVHAGVVGYICDLPSENLLPIKIQYNPYKAGDFISEGSPIKVAKQVLFDMNSLFLLKP